jgi:DnaJ-class molecular chaperone
MPRNNKFYGDDFRSRKEDRTAYYFKNIYKWKQRKCVACNGSGRYDGNGSPKCGGCDGTGKETYKV